MVEHSAVNRVVVGSSPTRGVSCEGRVLRSERALEKAWSQGKEPGKEKRLRGQAVKTSPFHGGNRGPNPLGVIFKKYADVAQLAEQLICNQQVIGSSPIIGFILDNRIYIRKSLRTFSSVG